MTAPRRIEGAATAESEWQPWLDAAGLKPLSLDGCLHVNQRLVVLAPHPDDEVLSCGALLTRHAERGGAALIVAATDGEASHAGDPQVDRGTLARRRHHERTEGLARLGLSDTPVRRVGLPDGGLAAAGERLDAYLLALLSCQDVLLTTWRLDGHPDHEACGRSAARVAAAIGCRLIEAPVWMWHWAAPGDPRVPWHRLHAFAVGRVEAHRKTHALNAHATQFDQRRGAGDETLPPVLDDAIVQRNARAAEHFFL